MNFIRPMSMTIFVFFAFIFLENVKADAKVDSADSSAIQQAIAELDQYRDTQKKIGIQDPDLSYAMRKAVVFADLLLSPDGKLNVSLCQAVKSAFISQNPQEYEVNIGRILDQLNTTWQPFFDQVVKPKDPNSISNLGLRTLLKLHPDEIITDRHAKTAVLAAMLAPFNQGPVGDCFAVSDLIRDHNEYYRRSAKDYADIIQDGFLTRLVGNQSDYFFFLPIIADGDCSNSFSIDSSGKIVGPDVTLLDAPGFAAASNIMGGGQIPNLSQNVAQLLLQGSQDSAQVSVSQALEALAEAILANQPQLNKGALLAQGTYAFSSLTNSPVLRATESAFAAMAEDRAQDSRRGNVNSCVAQALANTWSSLASDQQVNDFQKAFSDNFNASYRFIYNLNIPLPQVSADGSSTDGGFQLYKRVSGNPTQMGLPVKTPQDFQQLVLDVIAETESQLGSTGPIKTIASQVSNFVQNGTFLRDALWAYDNANTQEPNPVENYQKLSRTPMQSCDGDNPYEVADIDTGHAYDNDVQTFTPGNAKDLITWCLNLSKTVPAEFMPMNSPQHAFNFAPTNPDLIAFIKKGKNSDQWIRQMLCVPGMKVATNPIDTQSQTTLANGMWNMISNALPDSTDYQNLTASLAQQSMNVQNYAQALLDGINNLLQSNDDQANEVALMLDSLLLQALPANDGNILAQTSIRFAFTNWNEGTKDIYFCAYFNPRTQQVAFGRIDEDKTNLQPMDEQAWVNNKQWDVDPRPYAPTNLATGS
jgi:hypothetical protein